MIGGQRHACKGHSDAKGERKECPHDCLLWKGWELGHDSGRDCIPACWVPAIAGAMGWRLGSSKEAAMLEAMPAWTCTARYTLTQWYGHVHLLPGRALGQWLCIDRSDGHALWQKRFWRPNTIRNVADGVIIASETRSDGPWTLEFGCYGISLETGQLLWTVHARGMWGRLLRLLDFVPAFTNDLRDAPAFVQGSEVVCASGRLLDVRTGREKGRLPIEEVKKHVRTLSEALSLNNGCPRNTWARVRRYFDLANTGYHLGGNYYSYRYAAPFVYLMVSEERQLRDVPGKPDCVVSNPTVYHLLTLDLDRMSIVQDFRVADGKLEECRIEDMDEAGLLVSVDQRQVRYYRRQSLAPGPATGGSSHGQ
jgi:hypothetical protein